MSKRKLFGTDGIRGKANVYPMTSEIATALGRAVTRFFQQRYGNKRPLIILGKDTRRSCYMLEQAFSAGVCSQGGKVILTGPLPTPAVAFVVKSMRADAGVMISASHNNYQDNGIKLFDANGFKLPDSVELELENMVLNPDMMPVLTGADLGNAKKLEEVFGRYIVHVKTAFPDELDLEGMRVVLDCAHGAAYKVSPMVFEELGAEVFPLAVAPNGVNINDGCGSLYPNFAAEKVKECRADIGICLDGDADRLVVIDNDGDIVDGDKLIGLFAKLLLDTNILKKGDTVVGTVMSNLGLELYVKSLGLKFKRTKVGDRYIMEYMRENNSILGGEPSGHIIFANHSTTGDGTLAALRIIEAIKFYKKTLKQLTDEITLFPQVLQNIVVTSKPNMDEVSAIQTAVKNADKLLAGKGRVLLRYSGTEPLARVMVEGENVELVNKCCEDIVGVVKQELGESK